MADVYVASDKRYEKMVYNRVGKSGLKFPAVSLGFWHNFGSKDNYDVMKAMCRTAFDVGITQFDLANNYGPVYGSAEENAGKILREDFRPYRDELVVTTKAGYDMWAGPYGDWGSKKYLTASLDQSLKRLGLEYVDIFYHHRMDPETPLEETMEALASKAVEIMKELHCPLIVNQRRYSIFDRTIEEDGVKKCSKEKGMGIIAFSPLAQGLLTDKYLHGIPKDSRIARDHRFLKADALTPERLHQIEELNKMAAERGQTLAQMALSWILKDDEVCSVLIGASKPEQILENISIVDNTTFTDEEKEKINSICKIS